MTREEAIFELGYAKDFATPKRVEAVNMAIKALEQEPCDDAISRQAVVYYIKTHIHEIITESGIDKNERTNTILRAIINGVETMPSVNQPRWIPVSERLPEDIKPVIVTWKNTDPKSYYQYIVGKHFIGTAHYKSGKWFWYSSVTEDLLAEYGRCDGEEFDEAIEVVAWMPLPLPYKAESEEKE